MKVAIVGAGAIGGDIARRLALAGHHVGIADANGPSAVKPEVTAAGAHAVEMSEVTAGAEVLVLSVPFGVQPRLADLVQNADEATVIVDTSNFYPAISGQIDEVVDGQVESVWVQEQLGRSVVKAWNAALAETQQTMGRPPAAPGRIALPVAGDSEADRALIMTLVDDSGFDPLDAGSLSESWRQQPGTPAYCTELDIEGLRRALSAAEKGRAPAVRDRLMEHFASLEDTPGREETVRINRDAHR